MKNSNDHPDREPQPRDNVQSERSLVDAPSIFTVNNAVLVAVLQVGVVVISCLGAATSFRLTSPQGGPMRLPTLLLLDYWLALMAVPLAWIITALVMRRRSDVSSDAKGTVFWFGVVLLAGLLILGLCGFLGPLALDGSRPDLPAADSLRT